MADSWCSVTVCPRIPLLCQPVACPCSATPGPRVSPDVNSVFSRSFQHGLLPRLFYATYTYLQGELLDLPVGLMSRLVLGDVAFVDQFANCVQELEVRMSRWDQPIFNWSFYIS